MGSSLLLCTSIDHCRDFFGALLGEDFLQLLSNVLLMYYPIFYLLLMVFQETSAPLPLYSILSFLNTHIKNGMCIKGI